MRRRDQRRSGFRLTLGALILALTQEAPAELADNWYRVELLIFARDDAQSLSSEQWDPLPELRYPQRYRFLIDPALATQRDSDGVAYESRIDGEGRQHLLVPAPPAAIEAHIRPDVIMLESLFPEDPNSPGFLPELIGDGSTGDALITIADETGLDPLNARPTGTDDAPLDPNMPAEPATPVIDENTVLVATPYQLQPRQALEFRRQASTLRRRGQRVLFHGAWWAQLDESDRMLPLAFDRSGDPDIADWPELQGSILIYRSRYLHVETDLWLNTPGDYLPEGWQIEAPPILSPSVSASTIRDQSINPWEERPPLRMEEWAVEADVPPVDSALDGAFESKTIDVLSTASMPLPVETTLENPDNPVIADPNSPMIEVGLPYPWRHAIRHTQSRRMRSGELHYLDHPVIGVIVKILPLSEEDQPLAPQGDFEFRQRHHLPVEAFPIADLPDDTR